MNPEHDMYGRQKFRNESFNAHNHSHQSNIFKSYSTERVINTPDDALRNFCDSLYSDLRQVPRENLLRCKIEIMELIEKYLR